MNQLANPQFIKELFRHYGIAPKHYLGQNFLVDEIVLDEIVSAARLAPSDTVVEVGPGLGVLTQELCIRAGKVIAVEKDRTMLDILDVNLQGVKNVKVTNQDVLRMDFAREVKGKYKVVANIPYYLTNHLFQFFLGQANRPQLMVFLVQKEVAERVSAQPGEMSLLAAAVQLDADVEIMAEAGRSSFWPAPKVDSAVIRVTPRAKFPEVVDRKLFFRILKVAFAARRKQLHNNLANGLGLPPEAVGGWLGSCAIDPKSRAQDLSLDQWACLYRTFPGAA